MLVYIYDENTKEYLYSEEASKDPAQTAKQGEFVPLIPQFGTLLTPLKAKKDKAICFDVDSWVYQEDHRGQKVINPDTEEIIEVDYIGELKNGFVDYEIYINSEEYKRKQEEKEQKRVANLRCTKRVFVLMLQELGIDYYVRLLPEIQRDKRAQLEWDLCVELLRSNPLLDKFAIKFDITSEQLDNLFKYANGEITLEDFKGGV